MKKIPTLFERVFQNHKLVGITEKPIPGMEWVLDGLGEATIKYDGACCALPYPDKELTRLGIDEGSRVHLLPDGTLQKISEELL